MNDDDFLADCLRSAESVAGSSAPNPAVGACLVLDGEIVARGAHHGPGTDHAEIVAIKNALQRFPSVAGMTLYVSLEPCCHQGRTPPCTDAILAHGIKRVFFAYLDPNPKVAGRGQAILLNAGVNCQHLPIPSIDSFYQAYTYWQFSRLPWLQLKLATTSNGKIAQADAQPLAITGEQTRLFTHQKRRQADALLTSINTIINDAPLFNIRLPEKVISKPVFIIDPELKFSTNFKINQTAKHIYLLYADSLQENKTVKNNESITYLPIQHINNYLDIKDMLRTIALLGFHRVWTEVGAGLSKALLKSNYVNEFYLFVNSKTTDANAMAGPWGDNIVGIESLKIAVNQLYQTDCSNWQSLTTHQNHEDMEHLLCCKKMEAKS